MIKWIITAILIVILSALHIQGSSTEIEGHLLHQQLFFIPIILASFWFHLRAGLIVAILMSIVYLTTMLPHMTSPEIKITVISQIALYIFVAALIGWLTARLENQQRATIKAEKERSIVKLVSALSNEIFGIASALETKYSNAQEKKTGEDERDFREEINKLKQLTQAFSNIESLGEKSFLSQELNEILRKAVKRFQAKAGKAGVELVTEFDEAGCPSMVISESVLRLIDALIDNAIEASPKNSKVILRSVRKGTYCLLEVVDQGSGISAENVAKLFTPFFTTKPDGHGLSLAAGKKIMKNCEGDLLYQEGEKGGAVFQLVLPRENTARNLQQQLSEKVSE